MKRLRFRQVALEKRRKAREIGIRLRHDPDRKQKLEAELKGLGFGISEVLALMQLVMMLWDWWERNYNEESPSTIPFVHEPGDWSSDDTE